jgi:hypothetical protein
LNVTWNVLPTGSELFCCPVTVKLKVFPEREEGRFVLTLLVLPPPPLSPLLVLESLSSHAVMARAQSTAKQAAVRNLNVFFMGLKSKRVPGCGNGLKTRKPCQVFNLGDPVKLRRGSAVPDGRLGLLRPSGTGEALQSIFRSAFSLILWNCARFDHIFPDGRAAAHQENLRQNLPWIENR